MRCNIRFSSSLVHPTQKKFSIPDEEGLYSKEHTA